MQKSTLRKFGLYKFLLKILPFIFPVQSFEHSLNLDLPVV